MTNGLVAICGRTVTRVKQGKCPPGLDWIDWIGCPERTSGSAAIRADLPMFGRHSDGHTIRAMEAVLYFVVLAALTLWAAFWVIRLAVRYGMNDALRLNRPWLSQEGDRDPSSR